jgi:hypothetical protein
MIPPLVLHAENQHLRAQYRYHDPAVENVAPGCHRQLKLTETAERSPGQDQRSSTISLLKEI